MADYQTRQVGALSTLDSRLFYENNGVPVSPFHDFSLFANEEKTVLNMVVEIPRCKILRRVRFGLSENCFQGYIWKYGAFPQTWEDPNHIHAETKAKGDNDPIDVLETGEQVATAGQIKQVKNIGIMTLLDEGETDWKVLAIDVNESLAPKLNDIEDVEKHLPRLVRAITEWFRRYKIPDSKPENVFAFSGEAKNKIDSIIFRFKKISSFDDIDLYRNMPLKLFWKRTNVNVQAVDSPYKVEFDDEAAINVPAASVITIHG
ncbi:inorganic pyrophosphatase [Absidia repens]|uniref:inorganic diphosphatase n=1 Tax=Absidia repens TaxID=90262 RepID=A0A1X2II09_9FUNG|nr:inorganic pyrophosphatase [Absidia repens]